MPYYEPPQANILLAVSPDKGDRLRKLLEGHTLTVVASSAEAMAALRTTSFGMVLIGVHFDESRMFTLLCDIRQHAKYRKVPILCVLGERGPALSDVAVEGLDHAVKAMSANGFLDLRHFEDDEAGNARIRRIIDYLIMIDGDLQHLARAQGHPVVDIEERRRSQY